ncbi:MAG: glycosyltransferase family 39 protein [Actinomycetota bacterium]|nr:glycosyltransferase family 39 protein [Actinomycetota bacterium]
MILLGALLLRLWGIRYELPFVQSDEKLHFVPKAVAFFQNGYNPEYFGNPPGYSYLLHGVYWLRYGGPQGAVQTFLNNGSDVYLTARIVSAILGTITVWLIYMTAKRLFDARVGLASAALMAVAFLPTFYSHRALNDAPMLVPVTLSLFGSAGILLRGRRLDYVIAGVGLGLACATKYLGGIVLVPLVAAAAVRVKQRDAAPRVLLAAGLGGLAAVAAFLIANPFSVLDYRTFLSEIEFVSPARFARGKIKLGLRIDHGMVFYLWTMTWGLGWAPSIAALGGTVLLAIRRPAVALFLATAPILFVVAMGSRPGYNARYLLPVFPMLVLLAGYAVVEVLDVVRRHVRPRFLQIGAVAVVVVLLLGQSLQHVVHADVALTRTSTRTLARDWIFRHIPPGSRLFVEPIYLELRDNPVYRFPGVTRTARMRWRKVSLAQVLYWGGFIPKSRVTAVELRSVKRFVTFLRPELLDVYSRHGICWVITGSGQYGRAFNDPDKVPQAIAYYRELARRGRVAFHVRPYDSPEPASLELDVSHNYYRFEISRPGPEIIVYRLPAPRCR